MIYGYLRVSTSDQADSGAGLDAQREALEREADKRGWQLTLVADEGFSARTLKRPALAQVLLTLAPGDVLMVAKLDRLSRSLIDFATLMARAQEEGWAIICLDCPVDTTTAQGEMMAGVLALFAQFERRLISERTKDALAQRKAQGVRLGRPRMLGDDVREAIRCARESGLSYRRISRTLNDTGVPAAMGGVWYPATVREAIL